MNNINQGKVAGKILPSTKFESKNDECAIVWAKQLPERSMNEQRKCRKDLEIDALGYDCTKMKIVVLMTLLKYLDNLQRITLVLDCLPSFGFRHLQLFKSRFAGQ